MKPAIHLKRAYEAAAPADGRRVLIDGLWPRGLRKDALPLDDWIKDLAPSAARRQWFGHQTPRWPAFRERYLAELRGPSHQAQLRALLAQAGAGPLTLVYGARDTEHNNAVVLREALLALAAGGRGAARPSCEDSIGCMHGSSEPDLRNWKSPTPSSLKEPGRMNTHKHARLTFLRRLEMVQQLIAHQVCVPEAARAYGVTAPTVRKWLGRFLAQGQAGLADASSRPTVSPRAIAPAKALAIVELRRKRLTQARIAQALGVSASTVSRVLARAGLSHLADLEPAEPVVRYEHQAPGDLLHIDIKKLGRIQRPGHRVTGNRRDTVEGAGWDFVFVAIDDHARVAFTDIHPDERFPSAVQFLKDAVAYYQRLGVTIQRLLTDNGSAFRSRAFAALCHELGIKHRFTRPYRPQTNGKAERFIQSALREWAYAHTYQNSQHRADAMKSWLHHYNWHRPHQGIGRAVPISRLNLDEYNLLTVHT